MLLERSSPPAAADPELAQLRQQRDELQARLRLFERALDTIPDVISRIDRELRHVYVSAAVTPVTGLPQAAFLGKTNRELGMAEELVALWEDALTAVFTTGQPQEIAFAYPGPAGLEHYEARLLPEYAPDGSVESVLAIARNVTARVEAEQAHQVVQREQRAILETMPDLVWLTDAQGRTLVVNPAFAQFHQRAPDELIGTTAYDLFPLPLATRLHQQTLDVIRTGQRQRSEIQIVGPNGRLQWHDIIQCAVSSATGEVVGMVAIARDSTERSQIQAALRASEAQLRVLFDVLPVGVSIVGADRQIVSLNPALRRMLGLHDEHITHQNFTGWRFIDAQGQPLPPDQVPSVRATSEQRPIENIEIGVIKGDEPPIWTSVSAAPLPTPGLAAVVVTVDMTDRKQTEAHVRSINAQLAARLAELQQVTHDLTLLNELNDMLRACISVEEVCAISTQFGQELFPGSSGQLYLRRPSQVGLDPVTAWGDHLPAQPVEIDDCWALRLGRVYVVDGAAGPYCAHLEQPHPTSYLCCALFAEGEVIGLLSIRPAHDRPITEAQGRLAEAMAGHLALTLANIHLQAHLRAQAVRDPLTGLFNRRYLEETLDGILARVARGESSFGLLMVDIDHFKAINDTFGHDAGDAVLRTIGGFLRGMVREGDIACRYGGEEFILVLLETSLATVLQRAEELRAGVTQLVVIHRGVTLPALTVSVGVALAPLHGTPGAALIARADAALYAAKHGGRNQVSLPLDDATHE